MAELLEFEWERLVAGYKLERLDPDDLSFIDGGEEHGWFLAKANDDAPEWVRKLANHDKGVTSFVKRHLDTNPNYGDRYLVANSEVTERYRPLDLYPTLFMELADTEPTPEGAMGFINKFGLVTGSTSPNIGTPSDIWECLNSAKEIKSVVRSWDGYRNTGNALPLLRRIGAERMIGAFLHVKLQPTPKENAMTMVLVPNDLKSAIWLQLFQAITNNYGFRQCNECLAWFEVAPGKGRPEKRYCSNACSMRAYRKRKGGKT